MGANQNAVAVTVPVTLVTTAETIVVTTPLVTYDDPQGQGVAIDGTIYVSNGGTGGTAYVVRVYRGTAISLPNLIVATTITTAVSTLYALSVDALDQAELAGPAQYTVTVQQTGATGNSTITYAALNTTPCTAAS
jgi:hypothetical protein